MGCRRLTPFKFSLFDWKLREPKAIQDSRSLSDYDLAFALLAVFAAVLPARMLDKGSRGFEPYPFGRCCFANFLRENARKPSGVGPSGVGQSQCERARRAGAANLSRRVRSEWGETSRLAPCFRLVCLNPFLPLKTEIAFAEFSSEFGSTR